MPLSGPVLFTANHPSSFLDGIVIALTQPRKVYFLTRADVFRNPWISSILKSIGLIPIYRAKEFGFNVIKNKDVFESVFQIFDNQGAVIIFPEGTSRQERNVGTLKKGTSRLIQAYMKRKNSFPRLQVVPVGINYFSYSDYRAPLWIEYGEPMHFQALSNSENGSSLNNLQIINEQLHRHLSRLVMCANNDHELDKLNSILHNLQFIPINELPEIEYLNRIVKHEALDDLIDDDKVIQIKSMFQKFTFALLNIILSLATLIPETIFRISQSINRQLPLPEKFNASVIFSISFILSFVSFMLVACYVFIAKDYLWLLIYLSWPVWHVKRKLSAKNAKNEMRSQFYTVF